jgi:hypothetical protein
LIPAAVISQQGYNQSHTHTAGQPPKP